MSQRDTNRTIYCLLVASNGISIYYSYLIIENDYNVLEQCEYKNQKMYYNNLNSLFRQLKITVVLSFYI